MSLMEGRGGVVQVRVDTIDATTGREVSFGQAVKYIQVAVRSPVPVRIYFTEADWISDTGYLDRVEWEGPLEAGKFWLKSTSGSIVVETTMFYRRG